MQPEAADPIDVLHVDDDPAVLELTEQFLRRMDQPFEVATTPDVEEARSMLDDTTVDCVVSDYQMPGTDGLEFLRAVRDDDAELPFILFTGRGSEEIASEAIAAGVTDYLQKGTGPSQYTVLANRITNAAGQYRLERELESTRRRFTKLVEHAVEVIPIMDGNGIVRYITPSVRSVLGYEPEALVGENAFEYVHPADRERAVERFMETVRDPGSFPDIEYRFRHADGSWVTLYGRARNLLDDPDVRGVVSYNRDVTDLRSGPPEDDG